MSILTLLAASTYLVLGIRLALAIIALACVIFIIVVVLLQKGNSDGMEAMMGFSKSAEEMETFYEKNKGARRDAKLKLWTYICSGILAVSCIVFLILHLL